MLNCKQVVAVSSLLLLMPSVAQAVLPQDRTQEYFIRADPTVETSDVVFVVRFKLTALARDGETVDWQIKTAEFEELDSLGAVKKSWSIDEPQIATEGNIWRITHADADTPLVTEFDQPELMTGLAPAVSGTTAKLDYSLEGGTCGSGCSTLFSGTVTALTHTMQEVDEPTTTVEGDDEPTEIGGETIDP